MGGTTKICGAALVAMLVAPELAVADRGCAGYRMDVAAELNLAAEPAIAVTSGASGTSAPEVALDRRLAVTLWEESKVELPAPPGKRFDGGPFAAGVVALTVPENGTYAVSAASRAWFDLVDLDTGSVVEASAFDMAANCPALVKIVEFPLQAGRHYGIQVSSAPSTLVEIWITSRSGRP